jgi:signal transduction histidine kinase
MARARRIDPWVVVDLVWVALAMAVTESLSWAGWGPGTPIAGPKWLTVPWPALLFLPLLWRRSKPLLTGTLTMAALALQAVVSQDTPEGLALGVLIGVTAYSLAAYGTRRGALVGLLPLTAGYLTYTYFNRDYQSGIAADQWATGFFALFTLGWWVIGFAVHAWRDDRAKAVLVAQQEARAAAAVADERARIARELHDVVSHRLSVVVLQAEGAQAQAEASGVEPSAATMAKIEQSAREALVEMRRMLDVLRTEGDAASSAPSPGLGGVPALLDDVRRAGVEVSYDDRTNDLEVSPGLGLTVYRLIQEGLTNVIRHARSPRASVRMAVVGGVLIVRVADAGVGGEPMSGPGHGLTGMRERVALHGGTLRAGPGDAGGFVVEARLPLNEVAK